MTKSCQNACRTKNFENMINRMYKNCIHIWLSINEKLILCDCIAIDDHCTMLWFRELTLNDDVTHEKKFV